MMRSRTAVLERMSRDLWNTIVLRWNWKAALLSSLFRSSVFFTANLAAGWRAAVAAMATEMAYRAVTSGFYGALTQAFSRIQPAWRAAVTAFLILPLVQHSLELLIHFLRGTPKLVVSIVASLVFTGFSTLTNLFLMRNGVFVVGEGCKTLKQDLVGLVRLSRVLAAGLAAAWRGPATEGEA